MLLAGTFHSVAVLFPCKACIFFLINSSRKDSQASIKYYSPSCFATKKTSWSKLTVSLWLSSPTKNSVNMGKKLIGQTWSADPNESFSLLYNIDLLLSLHKKSLRVPLSSYFIINSSLLAAYYIPFSRLESFLLISADFSADSALPLHS